MFFERLKARCQQKNTSPTGVAVKLGIARGNVTNWKNGQMPGGETLIRLARELDCSADYLLGEAEIPQRYGVPDIANGDFVYIGDLTPQDKRELSVLIEIKRTNMEKNNK